MQRPVMNPTFFEKDSASARTRNPFKLLLRFVCFTARSMWRVATYDPLHRRLRIEEGTRVGRFIKGLFYRLAFLPVLIIGIVCFIVWVSTHPRIQIVEADLNSLELYYDVVTFMTTDNVRLDGAVFPVIDARQVLEEKERVLRRKYPAAVLVHDFGMRRDQLLPLVRPLHDAGFVVLAMNLRGNGASGASVASTFGLRESMDVKAAVDVLRRRSFVDPSRVVIIGAGTGGTAALIYAKSDPAIPALVVADPVQRVDQLLEAKLAPQHRLLKWMRPLCKWTFEIAYKLDFDDVAWGEFQKLMEKRPVLVLGNEGGHTDFTRPVHIEEIRDFVVTNLVEPKRPVANVKD